MGKKLYRVEPTPGTVELGFECPGCGCAHTFRIEGPAPVWTWNGDMERPTFAPSLLVRSGHYVNENRGSCWCEYYAEHPDEAKEFACQRCHLFLRDGKLQFLSDCSHELAGQTVPLPDMDSLEVPS